MGVQEDVRSAASGSEVWDKGEKASVKGLHLRVSKLTGVKAWYVYYRTLRLREQKKPRIGDYPTLTLAQARELARALLFKVAKGEDPSGEAQVARQEQTISDLWQLVWDEHYSQPETAWSIKAKQMWHGDMEATFGKLRISDVTIDHVEPWLAKFKERPYRGNRAFDVLRKMFNFAEKKRLRAQGNNPCLHVEKFDESKRDRYASDGELAKIGVYLQSKMEGNPRAVAFITLMIFTGSRPSLIERATWEHYDGVDGESIVFKVPGKKKRKTGKDDFMVVGPTLQPMLHYINAGHVGPLVGVLFPKKFWLKLQADLGLKGLWGYDLRRTYGTVGISEGQDGKAIQRLMNQDTDQAAQHYQYLSNTARVRAAGQMTTALGSKLSVPMLPQRTAEPTKPSEPGEH